MPARDILRLRMGLESNDASNDAGGIPQSFAANGTLDMNGGPVSITQNAATTITMPTPVAGQDDFKIFPFCSTTAQAHILSFGANKLRGNKTSWTWTKATAGLMGFFMAYQGIWYDIGFADAAAYAQQVTLA